MAARDIRHPRHPDFDYSLILSLAWHKADVPIVLTNVWFEAKNGHDAVVTPFPLMAQSGRAKGHPNYPNA
jgi:hypothetical protein